MRYVSPIQTCSRWTVLFYSCLLAALAMAPIACDSHIAVEEGEPAMTSEAYDERPGFSTLWVIENPPVATLTVALDEKTPVDEIQVTPLPGACNHADRLYFEDEFRGRVEIYLPSGAPKGSARLDVSVSPTTWAKIACSAPAGTPIYLEEHDPLVATLAVALDEKTPVDEILVTPIRDTCKRGDRLFFHDEVRGEVEIYVTTLAPVGSEKLDVSREPSAPTTIACSAPAGTPIYLKSPW